MEHVYKQIGEISAEEHAGRVVLFGSRARGTADAKSDIASPFGTAQTSRASKNAWIMNYGRYSGWT